MPVAKRVTVYLEEPLHDALRTRAAETDATISDLVNAAVRRRLGEDADDLAAFRARAKEPRLVFENLVRERKRSRK